MAYRAAFRCFNGCAGEHSLWQPIYRCPTCGGLLEVAHDLAALARVHAGDPASADNDRTDESRVDHANNEKS